MKLDTQYSFCPICKSKKISFIKNQNINAIRSDGMIIKEEFKKHHCHNCCFMWSNNFNSWQETRYLRSDGTSPFELERNSKVANGLAKIISKEVEAKGNISILEIGAGSFCTSEKLAELFPKSSIMAIERSPEKKPSQHHDNLTCIEADLENIELDKFDVVFSNMVLEHQENPEKFLLDCKSKLNETGIIITIVPNADIVTHEVLFHDHYSHFTSSSIMHLADKCNLQLLTVDKAGWDHEALVFILSKRKSNSNKVYFAKNRLDCTLFSERENLISSWSKYEAISLQKRRILEKELYLFGAGEYTQLVKCFLPNLYKHANGLIVTNKSGVRSFDKPIYCLSEIIDKTNTIILIGAKKSSRPVIKQKLANAKFLEENILDFEYI